MVNFQLDIVLTIFSSSFCYIIVAVRNGEKFCDSRLFHYNSNH